MNLPPVQVCFSFLPITIKMLYNGSNLSGQTAQTQIRLLLYHLSKFVLVSELFAILFASFRKISASVSILRTVTIIYNIILGVPFIRISYGMWFTMIGKK